MSALQLYSMVSTVTFVLLMVMIETNTMVGKILKAVAGLLSMFGFAVCLSVFGFVLAPGVRLI